MFLLNFNILERLASKIKVQDLRENGKKTAKKAQYNRKYGSFLKGDESQFSSLETKIKSKGY